MIKAIETYYNGYRFRSRLEARWAVFFDTIGQSYVYEPEGFEFLNGSRYLPDFWLPHPVKDLASKGWGMWAEIKPFVQYEAFDKVRDLALMTQHNGLIFEGQPYPGEYTVTKVWCTDRPFEWKKINITMNLSFKTYTDKNLSLLYSEDNLISSYPIATRGLIMNGFNNARSARFE